MKRIKAILRSSLGCCVLISFGTQFAFAQAPTGSITGVITDTSSAVIPDALITVLNTDTGVKRETISNGSGDYTVPLLGPGNYQITVVKDGFRPINRSGITLHLDQAARFDFSMELGAVTESVQIVAEASLIDSEKSSLGGVVQNRDVVDLPLNGRDITGLAFLVPDVVPGQATGGDSGRNPVNIWINGSRGNSSDLLVDGLSLTTPEFNPSLQIPLLPQVDGIQEFKVLTNSLPAEYGRTGGGIVEFVYKTGTNRFHGTAYDFLRNSDLDSNNFFNNRAGLKLPAFRRNQFGGTIGGPVLIPHVIDGRNKLFFFFGYEELQSSTGLTSTLSVPTLAERQGDFSGVSAIVGGVCTPVVIFDPYSSTQNPTTGAFTRTPFPNARIPTTSIDPVAAKIASYYPLPNTAGAACTGANNYIATGATKVAEGLPSARGDYNATSKDRFSLRYSGRFTSTHAFDAIKTEGRTADPKPSLADNGKNAAFNYDRTFTPTLIMELRMGFARILSISSGSAAGTNPAGDNFDMATALGWTGAAGNFINQLNRPLAFPQINVSGISTLGTGQQAYNNGAGISYQWAGSVTKIYGKHTIKAGFDFRVLQATGPNAFFASGAYTFTPGFTQGPNPTTAGAAVGNAFASMLTGLGTGQVQTNPRLFVSNHYTGAYVQDDYRLSKKLVLNIGLRYDVETGRTERHNQLSYFNFTAPSPLAGAVASMGKIYGPDQNAGLEGGLQYVGVNGDPGTQFNTPLHNLGPRAGLAYTLTPGTVIRAGYGILYEPFIGRAASSGSGYTGFSATTQWVSSLNGITPRNPLSNPYPSGLTPVSGSSLALLTAVGGPIGSDGANGRDGAFDRNSTVGYIQQWNFTIQRALPWNMAMDVGYVGNKGTHLADGGGFQMDQLPPSDLALGNQLLQTVPNPFAGLVTPGSPLSAATTTLGQLLRPYPQFTNVLDFRPSSASSIYHAGRFQLEKRFSHGMHFLAAYTKGKEIDDSSNAVDFTGLGRSGRHENVYNRAADRSLGVSDIAERLVISYVVELPFGKGKWIGSGWNRPTNAVLGGWQVNGIATFESGMPLIIENASPGINTVTSGFADLQRPNVSGNPELDGSRPIQTKLAQWFNTAAFSQPAAFTFGDTSRTLPNVRSDGQKNFDISFFKTFDVLKEGALRAQLRGELFNAFNHPQFDLPGMIFGAAGFGVVSNQIGTPRDVQFALKLLF